jgi:opacity protein-like surface antigen
MKKVFFPLVIAALALGMAITTFGQTDRNKAEVFVGYSLLHTDMGDLDASFNSHGINGAVTGTVSRYVGITGDISYHSKSDSFSDSTGVYSGKFRTTQYMGGVQIKDYAKDGGKLRPFARALAGVANQHADLNGTIFGSPFNDSLSTNNFALAVGGGLDLKVSNRVDIRLIQAEYNPIFFKDQTVGTTTFSGGTQNNFRLSFGIVIH